MDCKYSKTGGCCAQTKRKPKVNMKAKKLFHPSTFNAKYAMIYKNSLKHK